MNEPTKAEKNRAKVRKWKAANPAKAQAQETRRHARRRADSPQFALRRKISTTLNAFLNGRVLRGPGLLELGCTREQLKDHLETQFQPGMSWENYRLDGWWVDHLRPLSAYDLTDPAQLAAACHYTNLQPLWRADNIRKSNRI